MGKLRPAGILGAVLLQEAAEATWRVTISTLFRTSPPLGVAGCSSRLSSHPVPQGADEWVDQWGRTQWKKDMNFA